jgi:hypothetical protein
LENGDYPSSNYSSTKKSLCGPQRQITLWLSSRTSSPNHQYSRFLAKRSSYCSTSLRLLTWSVPLLVLPLVLSNSEPFAFLSKYHVCNNGPYGDLILICKALQTLLRGSFMHMFDPLCVSMWFTGCKPSNTHRDDSLLSLNDQMEWFRR